MQRKRMHGKKRSPFRDEVKKPIHNLNMLANQAQFKNIKDVEKEIGPPDKPGGWSKEEKTKLQRALSMLKATRKKYPIPDYSHKKDEYKVK